MSVVYNSNLIMLRKINDQSANVMQRQLINLSVNYFWACIFPMIGHFRSVRKVHWNPNVFFCAHFAHSAVFNCLYCIQYTVNVSQCPIPKIQSSSISPNLHMSILLWSCITPSKFIVIQMTTFLFIYRSYSVISHIWSFVEPNDGLLMKE